VPEHCNAGTVPRALNVDACSDAVKSWLSGASMVGSTSESGADLAERLRAAAPEAYED